jgi:hypothetical protein
LLFFEHYTAIKRKLTSPEVTPSHHHLLTTVYLGERCVFWAMHQFTPPLSIVSTIALRSWRRGKSGRTIHYYSPIMQSNFIMTLRLQRLQLAECTISSSTKFRVISHSNMNIIHHQTVSHLATQNIVTLLFTPSPFKVQLGGLPPAIGAVMRRIDADLQLELSRRGVSSLNRTHHPVTVLSTHTFPVHWELVLLDLHAPGVAARLMVFFSFPNPFVYIPMLPQALFLMAASICFTKPSALTSTRYFTGSLNTVERLCSIYA